MNRVLVVACVWPCPVPDQHGLCCLKFFPALSWVRTLFRGAVSTVPGVGAGSEGHYVCGASSWAGTKGWRVAAST